MSEALDLTTPVRENLRRARGFDRQRLLLVVSADHCPGCTQLEEQLRSPDLRRLLAPGTYLAWLKAGDLYDEPPRSIRLGSGLLESPGFPTSWLWDIAPDGLRLVAVALGPLDSGDPSGDIETLEGGNSVWVAEASGMELQVSGPLGTHLLNADNNFQAECFLEFPASEGAAP